MNRSTDLRNRSCEIDCIIKPFSGILITACIVSHRGLAPANNEYLIRSSVTLTQLRSAIDPRDVGLRAAPMHQISANSDFCST